MQTTTSPIHGCQQPLHHPTFFYSTAQGVGTEPLFFPPTSGSSQLLEELQHPHVLQMDFATSLRTDLQPLMLTKANVTGGAELLGGFPERKSFLCGWGLKEKRAKTSALTKHQEKLCLMATGNTEQWEWMSLGWGWPCSSYQCRVFFERGDGERGISQVKQSGCFYS